MGDTRDAYQSELDKYKSLGKIGEGTYGLVYMGQSLEVPVDKPDAKIFVAVKRFKSFKAGDGISPTAIREIKLLRELDNRFIVKLLNVHLDTEDKILYLIFDYAAHDLLGMIRHHRSVEKGPMPLYTVKSLLYQVLQGVNYLHKNWVIHRDLKPSNILVTGDDKPYDEQGVVKIADFGLARLYQAPLRPLSDADAVVVTIWYRAPELLLGAKHYTNAIDLWAIGCIFAELLTSKPLFQGREKERKGDQPIPIQADQIEQIFRILGKPDLKRWPTGHALQHWGEAMNWQDYPNKLAAAVPQLPANSHGFNLLSRLLEYDPTKRITAEQALHHPYFQEEPRPDQCVFVDHKDFYEAHATSDDNGKHTTGWPGKTSADGASAAQTQKAKAAPALTSAPPPKKKARTHM